MAEIVRPDSDPVVEQWRQLMTVLERVQKLSDVWDRADMQFVSFPAVKADLHQALEGGK
jgi:hypothetical protein